MQPLLKTVLIVIIAVGVAVPAGYFAYVTFSNSNPQLAQFVPLNSTSVARIDYNNTTIYAFSGSSDSGFVADVGLSQITGDLSGIGNSSSNSTAISITPEPAGTFHGYNIFSLTLTNVSLPINNSSIDTSILNSTNLANYTTVPVNLTLYIAELSGAMVSVGNLSSVHDSIISQTSGQNFAVVQNLYFDNSANASIYVNESNPYFYKLWANVFTDHTNLSIQFVNSTVAGEVNAFLGMSNLTSYSDLNKETGFLNVTLNFGFANYGSASLNVSKYLGNGTNFGL